MQVTLTNGLLRIQWQPLSDAIEAAILARLQGIPTAMPGNVERTWYVYSEYIAAVMEWFPRASFSPEVIALYPVQAPEAEPVQAALWDVEAIAQRAAKVDGIRGRNKFNRRKAKR